MFTIKNICWSYLALILVSSQFGYATTIEAENVAAIKEKDKIVIAHRGASGYFPEHSLQSKQLAFEMGADYIEQDLVLTKDNKLLVLHDLYLDRVTDVAKRYPKRSRQDGRFYAIDFNLVEIKTLQRVARFSLKNNKKSVVFKHRRWPVGSYKVHSFEEELQLIAKLNKDSSKHIGIYPEIKAPSFHRKEGKDISRFVLQMLKRYGYSKQSDKVYLQSFEVDELKRIRNELLGEYNMDLKLVQLIANTRWKLTTIYKSGQSSNYNYDWMLAQGAMQKIAQYAQAIGPYKNMLIKRGSTVDNIQPTALFASAHAAGLKVHPYTFRADPKRIAKYAQSFTDMLNIFYYQLGVQGVFTDHPDIAVKLIKNHQ
ncbi:MAG: glycerophosphoryl diester phosphodiesterase [Oceanospirillaceae bacterium]|jgi:glycerophosphoryl diester phosphodiesterase